VYRWPDDSELHIVDGIGTASFYGAFGLGRLDVGIDLPVHAARSAFQPDGRTVDPSTLVKPLAATPGDVHLLAKVRLLDGPAGVALWAIGIAPASEAPYAASAQPSLHLGGSFSGEVAGITGLVSGGYRTDRGGSLGDVAVGPEVTWGAGASRAISEQLRLSAELDGEVWIDASRTVVPAEWLLALTASPVAPLQLTLGGGGASARASARPTCGSSPRCAWSPPREQPDAPCHHRGADASAPIAGVARATGRCRLPHLHGPAQPRGRVHAQRLGVPGRPRRRRRSAGRRRDPRRRPGDRRLRAGPRRGPRPPRRRRS
jgi:hypothetical protein